MSGARLAMKVGGYLFLPAGLSPAAHSPVRPAHPPLPEPAQPQPRHATRHAAARRVERRSRRINDVWRRDRDSNPGDGFPPTRVPGVRLRPLGHLSGACSIAASAHGMQVPTAGQRPGSRACLKSRSVSWHGNWFPLDGFGPASNDRGPVKSRLYQTPREPKIRITLA